MPSAVVHEIAEITIPKTRPRGVERFRVATGKSEAFTPASS
jgi:hypothetical protein